MVLADYDRDGRATELVLQVGAGPCGHEQSVVVGISKQNPDAACVRYGGDPRGAPRARSPSATGSGSAMRPASTSSRQRAAITAPAPSDRSISRPTACSTPARRSGAARETPLPACTEHPFRYRSRSDALPPRREPQNRFSSTTMEYDDSDVNPGAPLEVFEDHSRSILASNDSPDVGFKWSVNPYRGCFHACNYCFARPSHEYLSSARDPTSSGRSS